MIETPNEVHSRRPSARARKVGVTTLAYALLGGVLALILVRVDTQAEQRCEDNRDNRAVLRELVETVTSPVSAGGGNLAALESVPEFQALDADDQAFWRVVFAAIGAPSAVDSADPPPTSLNDRLIDFAKARLTSIDCD